MSWYNPVSWWIDKENLDAGNAAATKVQEMNRVDYSPGGVIYEGVAATRGLEAAQQNLETVMAQGQGQTLPYDAAVSSVNQAFVEGWGEAVDSRLSQSRGLVQGTLKTVFGALPWYVWLGLVIVGFFYIGGLPTLKKYVR